MMIKINLKKEEESLRLELKEKSKNVEKIIKNHQKKCLRIILANENKNENNTQY